MLECLGEIIEGFVDIECVNVVNVYVYVNLLNIIN